MTKRGENNETFAYKQNGGPLGVRCSTLTNFNEIWLKLFLMIFPSNKSTGISFKSEALQRYRVKMVQNGADFPGVRQDFHISNVSSSKVMTTNYVKLGIKLKDILFLLQQK